jgi:AcrR family transcriptional regulator
VTDTTPALNRRERLRVQTLREIEDACFGIIDAEGVDALSIAAVARSMVISAPALYRYFPSRDALVTHLVTLSYQDLADTMSRAVEGAGGSPGTRLRLLVAAYRDWALGHRRRYGMLFGERVADPPGGTTANTPLDQSMALLVDMLTAIQDSGPPAATSGDRTLDGQLRDWARTQQRPGTSPSAARAAIVIWTRVHGIVSLELTGVFDNQAIEAQRLIDLETDDAIRSLKEEPRHLRTLG